MSNTSVRLVIADGHPVLLRGLISLLGSERPFTIVACCSNGTESISIIRRLRPHIALLDTSMSDPSGLEILEIVRAEELPTRIVLLSASRADHDLAAAVGRGVDGILFKDCSPDTLVRGLREVASGRTWLSTSLFDEKTRREDRSAVFRTLTDRECEVMFLASTGLTNKQIARQLSICEGTVKLHLHNVYCKVAVNNRTALAALARANCDVLHELRGLGNLTMAAVRAMEVAERERAFTQSISNSLALPLLRQKIGSAD